MADIVEELFAVWSQAPPADDGEAEAAFARLYTDPVPVNGAPLSCRDLAARARSLHAALADIGMEVVDRLDAPGGLAVTIRQTGRLVGPLATALGPARATGGRFDVLSIDVLHVAPDGRISAVWVVADELSRLVQAGALTPG